MHENTVLFACPDNSLLGPLAEAYLNARGAGFLRAFSGGLEPAQTLHPTAKRLLRAHDLSPDGLVPKSLDVFFMPMAPKPDRIVLLSDLALPAFPEDWQGSVPVHIWSVAGKHPLSATLTASAEYFRRIRSTVDAVIQPIILDESAA